jgi:2-hydroxychromene-2-carboxylate isomerase
MPKTLEFFFDLVSPYSYLASTQLDALAERTGARVLWRPFLLGAVFKATENVSPATIPAKGLYLLKDFGDWSRHYGLPALQLPEIFPFNSLLLQRLALVADEQGRLPVFGHRMYRAIYQENRDVTSAEEVTALLAEEGMDAKAYLARAEAAEIKDRLKANVEEAVRRGAFGAPTFFIGEEMFVGNDRLMFVEKALRAP